jgi:hypothetical protein
MILLLEEFFRIGESIEVDGRSLTIKKLNRVGTDSIFIDNENGNTIYLDLSIIPIDWERNKITKLCEEDESNSFST